MERCSNYDSSLRPEMSEVSETLLGLSVSLSSRLIDTHFPDIREVTLPQNTLDPLHSLYRVRTGSSTRWVTHPRQSAKVIAHHGVARTAPRGKASAVPIPMATILLHHSQPSHKSPPTVFPEKAS